MPDYAAATPDELEPFYKGLFGKARAGLGVSSFGLSVVNLGPHAENYPDHDHPGGQEEVFIVLSGTGEMDIDGGAETIALVPETMVRVGPETKRRIRPGADGMRLVAIGGTPGMAYDAPAYTELGAPDPLS